MQVVLVMFLADGTRRSFPLKGDVTVIGRREDCDLRIPLTEVSRKHCRLVKDSDGLRLEDLGSSNGTYHNGTRIQETSVQPGDQIQIGPVIFTVQIDGAPADDLITPPQTEDAQSSSMGAQLPDVADETTSGSPEDSPTEPSRAGAFAGRPLAPQGDDFLVGGEETEDEDDDIVDLDSILSPSDDEELK